MLRPRSELPLSGALHTLIGKQSRIAPRIDPGTDKEAVGNSPGCRLVKVCAGLDKLKANAALRALAAIEFCQPTSRLPLVAPRNWARQADQDKALGAG